MNTRSMNFDQVEYVKATFSRVATLFNTDTLNKKLKSSKYASFFEISKNSLFFLFHYFV